LPSGRDLRLPVQNARAANQNSELHRTLYTASLQSSPNCGACNGIQMISHEFIGIGRRISGFRITHQTKNRPK